MVPVASGSILMSEADHFYIQYKQLTYDVQALKKFGTRLDYKEGVPVLDRVNAARRIKSYLRKNYYKDQKFNTHRKPHIGGKNIGGFDAQFLKALDPEILECAKHRYVDLGNLFHRFDDNEIPDLSECLRRGKAMGIQITRAVTHTALDDAIVCAELYVGMYNKAKHANYFETQES